MAEDKVKEIWTSNLQRWINPILIGFLLFIMKEYYVKMDTKLTIMMNHIYRSDSVHLRMNVRMDYIEKEQGEHGERIRMMEDEFFYLKPDDIKLKKKTTR